MFLYQKCTKICEKDGYFHGRTIWVYTNTRSTKFSQASCLQTLLLQSSTIDLEFSFSTHNYKSSQNSNCQHEYRTYLGSQLYFLERNFSLFRRKRRKESYSIDIYDVELLLSQNLATAKLNK